MTAFSKSGEVFEADSDYKHEHPITDPAIVNVIHEQVEEDKMIERLNEFVTVVDNYIKHL